jgi:hypothetical protein
MSKTWGPSCWYLIHSLATKVKEDNFNGVKDSIWSIIFEICRNLPCPECREHATKLMSTANKNLILSSKRNLELYLFDFHNSVNKRKAYRTFTIQEYDELYGRANMMGIIGNFVSVFNVSTRNNKQLLDTLHRQLFIKRFIKWIDEKKECFSA